MSLSVYRDEGIGPSVEVRAIHGDSLTRGARKEKGWRSSSAVLYNGISRMKGGGCAFSYSTFSFLSRNGIHFFYGHELMPLHDINRLLLLTDILLRLGKSESVEVLREVAAALRNISLSEHR